MLKDTSRSSSTVLRSAIRGADVDVSFITPPGTPGVSDLEDFNSVLLFPADNVDSMVEFIVAAIPENTTTVTHEAIVGINSDGKRTIKKGFLDGLNTFSGNSLGILGSSNFVRSTRRAALTLRSSVCVVCFRHDGCIVIIS